MKMSDQFPYVWSQWSLPVLEAAHLLEKPFATGEGVVNLFYYGVA